MNIHSSGKECTRDSTHSCEDVQALVKLNKTLDETLATFKHAIPNIDGLIFRKAACKATAKFKSLKLQKVVETEGFGNLKLYTQRDWTAAIGTELVNEQPGYERYLAV